MTGNKYSVSTIGAFARQICSRNWEGRVLGQTSRGVFVQTNPGRILFLSLESYRGPLTLNVDRNLTWPNLHPGSPVRNSSDGMCFVTSGITFHGEQAVLWVPPPPMRSALPLAQLGPRLQMLARKILALRGNTGFSYLLPGLLDLLSADEKASPQDTLLGLVEHLRHTLGLSQPVMIASALTPILGMGVGLTPSGDDLALGLLLSLNRWGEVLQPALEIRELNGQVISLAYQKTMTLSANLIECAAMGQADERLLDALDGILTGEPELDTCLSLLCDLGSSSGIDALVGMVFAIMSNPARPR